MSRKIVVYKFPDGTTASLPAEEVERRVREQMRDLRQRLIADEHKQQVGMAISEGKLNSKRLPTLQGLISQALLALGDKATDAEVLAYLRAEQPRRVSLTTRKYDITRGRKRLLRRYPPQT